MDMLLIETMESYNEYLQKLPDGCQKVADYIRQDNLSDAFKGILQFSEGVAWLINANQLLEKNSFVNQLNPEKINEYLNEINSGLQMQDYVIVADMFEYEIKPFFEESSFYDLSERK